MNCIAVDDEKNALEVIKLHASKVDFLNLLGLFTNPVEASKFVEKNKVDLIFLDINMPGINGFEFIETLSYQPAIIFTTAYSEYAVESYNINALDYLVKPIPFSRFLKAVNKAEQSKTRSSTTSQTETDHDTFISVKSGNAIHRIRLSDITYIEADGNYACYHTKQGKIMSLSSMKNALEDLDDHFIQVHRSYIVSRQKINKIENHQLTIGDKKVPIGISYRRSVLEELGFY